MKPEFCVKAIHLKAKIVFLWNGQVFDVPNLKNQEQNNRTQKKKN